VTRKPGDTSSDEDGGRAAERLREFERARGLTPVEPEASASAPDAAPPEGGARATSRSRPKRRRSRTTPTAEED
jgi:hypothetical protein